MSASVDIANIVAALKIGSSYDWRGAIAAFESEDTKTKIVDGLIAVDDVAKIVGLFFPPAAVFANDLGMAIEIGEVAYPIAVWLSKVPPPDMTGKVSVWGANVEDKGLLQD